MWVNMKDVKGRFKHIDSKRLVEEGKKVKGSYVDTKPGVLTDR